MSLSLQRKEKNMEYGDEEFIAWMAVMIEEQEREEEERDDN